jgi:hypothetical protein
MACGLRCHLPDVPGLVVEGLSSVGGVGHGCGVRHFDFQRRIAALVQGLERECIPLELPNMSHPGGVHATPALARSPVVC